VFDHFLRKPDDPGRRKSAYLQSLGSIAHLQPSRVSTLAERHRPNAPTKTRTSISSCRSPRSCNRPLPQRQRAKKRCVVCLSEISDTDVQMAQSAQDWQGEHAPSPLDFTRNRCIALPAIGARNFVMTLLVGVERVTKVVPAEDEDVIQVLSPHRSGQVLRDPFLPRQSPLNSGSPDAHGCEAPNESAVIGALTITNDILRWFSPAEGFGQLTGYPLSSRICGHAQMTTALHSLADRCLRVG